MRLTLACDPRSDCAESGAAAATSDAERTATVARRGDFTAAATAEFLATGRGMKRAARKHLCGPVTGRSRTGEVSLPTPAQRCAYTFVLPALSNAMTSYFSGVPPSIPG